MGAIDVWAQVTTPRMGASRYFEPLMRWSGRAGESAGTTVEATLAAMDQANVDMSLLAAWHSSEGDLITNEELIDQIESAPDRFRGLATVDLSRPMESVRRLRELAQHDQIVGVRIVPWMWDLPPNDRRYYPIYTACIDLGLPFCTQIGHTGPLRTSETGRLIPYLEDVLLDFPELVVVGGHVGFPWINELTSLTVKFPNLYVDTSAYALHRLPPDFITYMKTVGRKRVMFGTNWPMIPPAKCLSGLDGLALDDNAKTDFLSGIARKVFKL